MTTLKPIHERTAVCDESVHLCQVCRNAESAWEVVPVGSGGLCDPCATLFAIMGYDEDWLKAVRIPLPVEWSPKKNRLVPK